MPKIVGIHGIGQQYLGGNSLREVWLPRLKDGIIAAGHRGLADGLSATDLIVSFYGDLFRPKAALGEDYPPFTAEDLDSGAEIDLLNELYDEACSQEPSLGPPEAALGPGFDAVKKIGAYPPVQVRIERLLRSRTFAGLIPERAFVGNLKQVISFVNDANVKQRVLVRVDEEVSDDTHILIGHSLGSVVAYEYLCRYRPAKLQLLVTLGSPLGIRNVVFDRLTPTPTEIGGAWPGVVSTDWVNVADPRDIVAMRKDLAPLFPPPEGAEEVSDRLVNNGDDPHGIGPYLTAEETGTAIAAAL